MLAMWRRQAPRTDSRTKGMTNSTQPVLMTVLAGTFANQASAFYALRMEASKLGVDLLPERTDVIREAADVRLAHYFRPAVVARVQEAQGDDDTVFLLFPSRLTAIPSFPGDVMPFRVLGRYSGLLADS